MRATFAATPSLPLPLTVEAAGHLTCAPKPTASLKLLLALERKLVKIAVVPEPSARVTTVIGPEGIFIPGFNRATRLSLQSVTLPWKISDNKSPESLSWFGPTPSMFTTTTTPPIIAGNWTMPWLWRSSNAIGASVAPKSTVLALICLIPPPEPIDW